MKKILSLLLVLLTLMLPLVSCHGSAGMQQFTVPEEFDTSRTYEITFWAKNDTNLRQVEVYKKAIADFEALYPNIKVNMRLYTDYGRIYNDVITNIATNTTPNVCITYPDHIATYMSGTNTVVQLDELMTDEKYGLGGSEVRFDGPTMDEIVPKFLEECIIDSSYYALPYMRSTEACYINKTYVERLGYTLPEVLTWDFVWEVSEAALEKGEDGKYKVNGQEIMIPFIYKSTDNMMISMLRQLDAGYSTDEGDILIFNDTTKDLLFEISTHAGTRAFSTFKISSYPGNFLNAGQCIFAIDSTAGATWMGSDAPNNDIHETSIVEFETEVMMIPQFDTENPKMISQGPSICIFNKDDPQEVLASWLFTQFMLTNDVQLGYSDTEGYLPVTTKVLDSEEFTEYMSLIGTDDEEHYAVKLEAKQILIDNLENTFVTPVFNGSASLRDAAGQLIENVTKSMRRKETVDEGYMEDLFHDINALHRLDQLGASTVGQKAELGKMPTASVVLLSAIGGAWVIIVIYVAVNLLKKRKK
ncbi:MAG: extracellular solute-binding protein [Ruminococcaceae bacterium]|nr:extracellular solute-binding protein [Oscillospiraceae bacterium]